MGNAHVFNKDHRVSFLNVPLFRFVGEAPSLAHMCLNKHPCMRSECPTLTQSPKPVVDVGAHNPRCSASQSIKKVHSPINEFDGENVLAISFDSP